MSLIQSLSYLKQLVALAAVVVVLVPNSIPASQTKGQISERRYDSNVIPRNATLTSVETSMRTICIDRAVDPQSTKPIDEMAMTRPVPMLDHGVIAATARAQALLPVAKRLFPFALNRIASTNGVDLNLKWTIARLQKVRRIHSDVAELDNSSWRPMEPDAIVFGTVFLLGLRSDEAMLAVLGHELTHAVDGTDDALLPLFRRIATRTADLQGTISLSEATELACEMVGAELTRDYITQTSNRGSRSQRLARVFEKDCVIRDISDENHLSPRQTMRTVLRLQPDIAAVISSTKNDQIVSDRTRRSTKATKRTNEKRFARNASRRNAKQPPSRLRSKRVVGHKK